MTSSLINRRDFANILPRHDEAQANGASVDADGGYCFQQRLVIATGMFRQIEFDKVNRREQVNDCERLVSAMTSW